MSLRRLTDSRLAWAAFTTMFVGYAAVGYWLQVRHGFIIGDALARVAAAQSVLFSRSPHLAAIGFIFTPLTAMVQIPLVALSALWPPMAERAFSGTLMSAAFMAGAVYQTLRMGMDRGLPRAFTLTIVALFALNPMIIFYGSNGMSEAPFVFFVVWAARRLTMWMVDNDVHHLVVAGGIAMGLAYLTRYDAAAAIGAAGFLVAITTYVRARGKPRLKRALLGMIIVSGPGLAAFIGWAVASWMITGLAFAQFGSRYGNTAILEQEGGTGASGFTDSLTFSLMSFTLLAPTLLVLIVGGVWLRWGRPNWSMLAAPLTVFGAVLAFQVYSFSSGSTFPFLRFYIIAIPFAAAMALMWVPDGPLRSPARRGRYPAPPVTETATDPRRRWVYAAAALLLAVCVPVAGFGMAQPKYAPQEYGLGAVVNPDPDDVSPRKADERALATQFSTERAIAEYLERKNLPDSSILTDPVYAFSVIAASQQPKAFIVPSDPDFVRLLSDPSAHGIEYMLAIPNEGRGTSDALNLRYPTLYETGADVATLELEVPNNGKDQPTWRLYKVKEPTPPPEG
ncbi:ArnT family glycosyltransferase [Mycobacterium sp. NPDC051804]|uniref:ArnT family glycosyltransferase n=1 Tax=Mycobacterium sp. NPDC051804 TaxID=3364295 RepID=UPI00378865B1